MIKSPHLLVYMHIYITKTSYGEDAAPDEVQVFASDFKVWISHNTHLHICIYICMHIYKCVYNYTILYMHIYKCVYNYASDFKVWISHLTHVHICIYICMHIYKCVYNYTILKSEQTQLSNNKIWANTTLKQRLWF